MKLAENRSYIPEKDRLVVETIYDPSDALKEAEEARQRGGVKVGSKGQEMLLACVLDMDHILALKNMGYDLLSPDPAEWRRALLYVQQNQQQFMATDKKVFTGREAQKWV